ncbi:Protein FAR1-RELATED SEQUENCE 5 [Rhynchospora pubera]|uniref:Protein FAR1-RELATED SEQUENCE n=1 Tax=Rhynchospora pubera TaxID=906938 RepID=A0AAV8FXC9_9POAL|nr:Protein FAR1-RELATED SEQUENCE 5 [Rhynchospora pubera]
MDGRMIAAYARFGEVVIFDTTFGTNEEKWALGTFVGFNNFREIVIFGAALMCDQSTESFAWVFDKFVEANCGKRPITVFTDQDSAIGKSLEQVLPDTKHALCVWHIMKNAQKKLCAGYKKKDKNDTGLLGEFCKCMFKYEVEEEFEKGFKELAGKVDKKDERWIKFIFDCKEKWAYCFMKDAYTLGIRSTQASESINSDLKNYLSCKLNVNRFMDHFERIVDAKREKEIKSDYYMTLRKPKVRYNIPILCEAGDVYTTNIFELFQKECELSGSAYIESIDGNIYTVGMCNINVEEPSRKSRQVVWNRDEQTIVCSCKKFERVGILCCHAIKVLDREDIKNIPPRYILKRWTQDANDDTVVDREGRVIEDAMLEVRNRKAQLMREASLICDKVVHDESLFQFVLDGLRFLLLQVEERDGNHDEDNSNSQLENSLRLKKKDGDNRSKRRKAWNENLSRKKKDNGQNILNSQSLIRPSNNLSQDITEEHFGCYGNLEDIQYSLIY